MGPAGVAADATNVTGMLTVVPGSAYLFYLQEVSMIFRVFSNLND